MSPGSNDDDDDTRLRSGDMMVASVDMSTIDVDDGTMVVDEADVSLLFIFSSTSLAYC